MRLCQFVKPMPKMVSVEKNPDHLVQEPDYERFSLCSNLLIENPLKFSARFSKIVWPTMMRLGQIVKSMPKMVSVEKNLDHLFRNQIMNRFPYVVKCAPSKGTPTRMPALSPTLSQAQNAWYSLKHKEYAIQVQNLQLRHPSAELAIAQSVTRAFQHQEA